MLVLFDKNHLKIEPHSIHQSILKNEDNLS